MKKLLSRTKIRNKREENMVKTRLNNINKKNILEKLKSTWDIKKRYWYPLEKCVRNDVISFDSEYINKSAKISFIKSILEEHDVVKLYEFREHGLAYEIDNISDYTLWQSDDYFMCNEGFWFDDTMSWIIYKSHEDSITFGGEWIRSKLKEEWKDWYKNLRSDTKNRTDNFIVCFCKEESYDLILEADFCVDPIWCGKCGCNLNLNDIPLSEELKHELMNWVDGYSKTVLDESEYIYEVSQKHNKNGLELLEKVQKELGDKYTISYISSE